MKKKKLTIKNIRDKISTMDEEEVMLIMDASLERLVDRGWQWGDILSNVWGWLGIHARGAREEYMDGSHPEYYYGPKD